MNFSRCIIIRNTGSITLLIAAILSVPLAVTLLRDAQKYRAKTETGAKRLQSAVC